MAQSAITISGNLGDDPEFRFTPNGAAVARMSVGVTERQYDKSSGQWRDTGTSWFTVIAWNQLAENCAESLTRGSRVVVSGVMKSRSWETKDGESRTSWEITADEVGASLRFASAQIKRTTRARPTSTDETDPWAGTGAETAPAGGSGHEPAESGSGGTESPGDGPVCARSRKARTTAPAA